MSVSLSPSSQSTNFLATGAGFAVVLTLVATCRAVTPMAFVVHGHNTLLENVAILFAAVALFALIAGYFSQQFGKSRKSSSGKDQSRFIAAANVSFDALLLLEAVRGPQGEIEDFIFTYSNSRGQELFNLPSEHLAGARLCHLLPVFRREGLFEQYKTVVSTGEQSVSEFSIEDDHINATWLRCSVVKLGDGVVVSASDLTSQKKSERALSFAVQHDGLTGLPNRLLLDDRIQQMIERSKRNRHRGAVLMVDIDGFSSINEKFGREAGNHVLKTVATRLRTAVRSVDSVFRLGGDEFVVLVGDLPTQGPVVDFSRKILMSLRQPIVWRDARISLSANIGSALYPTAGTSPETLLVQADISMHRMKRAHDDGSGTGTLTDEFDAYAFPLSVR